MVWWGKFKKPKSWIHWDVYDIWYKCCKPEKRGKIPALLLHIFRLMTSLQQKPHHSDPVEKLSQLWDITPRLFGPNRPKLDVDSWNGNKALCSNRWAILSRSQNSPYPYYELSNILLLFFRPWCAITAQEQIWLAVLFMRLEPLHLPVPRAQKMDCAFED